MAVRLVRLAARSLPAGVRDRYREEWLADLDGAEEAGVSRAGVVAGALTAAVTISRIDPALTGLTLGETFIHRLRVASGLLTAAAVLGVGYLFYGGYSMPYGTGSPALLVVGAVALAVAIMLGLAGGVALVGAIQAAAAARRFGVVLTLILTPLALVAIGIVAPYVYAGLAILGGPVALIVLVVIVILGVRGGAVPSARRRALIAGVFGAAALGVCAFAILHVAVWNPLARVPGLTLDEIYAGLADAREATGVGVWLGIQAIATALGTAALLLFAFLPRRDPLFATSRRLVAAGFLLIAGTTAIGYLPAFSMGMGLADTFMTSGGDAAASGPLLAIVGQVAVVATLLVITVRPALPRPALLPPPVGPARA